MTHRHAFRRGVAPRASEKDMRTWSRLVTRATALRVQEREGSDRDWAFERAAARASKAILPAGYQSAGSPFVRLVRLAAGFPSLDGGERVERLNRIKEAAGECLIALHRIAEAEPAKQASRKDIYG